VKLHSKKYRDYLNSIDWYLIRVEVKKRASGRCERCSATGVEVHHRTYERLGHERLDDLELLCKPCHGGADRERRLQQEADFDRRRMEGWASKVFGEDEYWWPDDVEERFDEWVSRRDD
jgi:hypothetical protein